MSERSDLTPENLAQTLGRFTPESASLERDLLLFRAGQRSVRRSRFWPSVAAALLIGQTVTLSLWLQRPDAPSPGPAPQVREIVEEAEPTLPAPEPPFSYAALRQEMFDLPDRPERPEPSGHAVVQHEPLTVRSSLHEMDWR